MAHTLEIDPITSTAEEVAAALGTDPETGLSSQEAARRLAEYGPNELQGTPPTPRWKLFVAQFNSPLIYLLLGAIVISTIAWALDPGSDPVPVDAIVIALIVLLNAVLGYVQESKAADAVAALQSMTTAHSVVLRDEKRMEINSTDLVVGDILVLGEGDEVGADGRLVYSSALRIAESSLTGESEPVEKEPGVLSGEVALGDRTNMVHKGTAVTQGVGRAVVTHTGMATEMGAIATMLDSTEEEPSPLTREIEYLGKVLGIAVIIIAAVVMATAILMSPNRDLNAIIDALILAVSLAVAAVPEGLAAILTVVLSMGTQRMAAQNAIVKDLSSVETLGSASVIASDKTGTLTRNEMTIQKVVTASGEIDISGVGYSPEGGVTESGKPLMDGTKVLAEAQVALRGGAIANDASLDRDEEGSWQIQGDPTEAAFLVAAHKVEGVINDTRAYERLGEVPFTSARKMMSVVGELPDTGTVMYTKGAPDVLLSNCSTVLVGNEQVPLDDERRARILAKTERLAGQAYRTLAVAFRDLASVAELGEEFDEEDESDLCFVAIAAMMDPPRTEAAASVAEAHRAGIRVLMITGDHPATAARIASDLGIVEPGEEAVTGVQIDRMDDAGFAQAVRDHSVFARVTPKHKMRIVDTLQAQGEIISMTGDGVNDAPALKSADIGVAMGITGTEVTKEAANMILADDNFATIVAAVKQGRIIFDNIRKFLRFLLSSNMGEVITVFFGTLLAGVLGLRMEDGSLIAPLLATQILWINLLTDSAPALAMGVDPAVDDVMARKPRKITDRVINRHMGGRILLLGLIMGVSTLFVLDWYLPGGLFDGSGSVDMARTAAFTTLVLAQLFNAFNSRSAYQSAFKDAFSNHWLWWAVLVALALQVLVVHVPFLQDAFGTTALSLGQWLFCLAVASSVLWIQEIHKLILRWQGREDIDE